jgi:DNA-binding response OmpR family regulator
MKKPVILVVEDNPAMLEVLDKTLSAQYEVVRTENGLLALEMLRGSLVPDLLLLDLMLPFPLDGLDVLRAVKNNKTLKAIPVIMMSAMNYEDKVTQSLALGAQDFIVKPFKLNHLLLKINNLLLLRSGKQPAKTIQKEMASQKQDTVEQHFCSKFEEICERLIEAPNTPIQEIAAEMSMSISTLERWVQRIYKVTPKRFLLDKKLDHAETLLLSKTGSVKAISIQLGFSSVPYFCFCFKNRFGNSPKQHAKKKVNNPVISG